MSDTIDDLVDDPQLRLRLEHHLAQSGRGVDIRRTPLPDVVRRATVRGRRQRMAGAVAASFVVIAAVAGVVAGGNDDRTIVNVDEPPTIASDVDMPTPTRSTQPDAPVTTSDTPSPLPSPALDIDMAPSSLVDSPYEWQSIDPDDASRSALEFMVSSWYNDRGTLGWTYNEMSPSDWVSTVFVSDDGITWAATPTSPGLSVVGGTDTTDAIHIVGYASSADPDAGKVFVATSEDRGATWRRDPLPFDLSPAWGSDAMSVRLYPSEMAVSDATIVVAIQPMSTFRPSVLDASTSMSGFVYLPDGVGVLRSCEGCPVGGPLTEYDAADIERVLSWEELGVTDEQASLIRATPSVHVSGPDGFREVDVPFANSPSGFWLTSTSASILAVEQRLEPATAGLLGAPARLYETTDGRSWRRVGEAPLQTGRAGLIDGRYVVVGADLETGDPGIASSIDGLSWTIHPLPPDSAGTTWGPSHEMSAIDGDTLAIAGYEVTEPPERRLTENGVTMIFDAGLSGDVQFIDDTTGIVIGVVRDGERSGQVRLDENPADGDPTLAVLDDEGNVRADFSLQEVIAATQVPPSWVQRVAIYTTHDLSTWARVILDDVVADGSITLNAVDLVDDRVIVRMAIDRDGDPLTFDNEVLLAVGALTR